MGGGHNSQNFISKVFYKHASTILSIGGGGGGVSFLACTTDHMTRGISVWGGTHPTGMDSCLAYFLLNTARKLRKLDWRYAREDPRSITANIIIAGFLLLD